jgi:hypothetical protein
MNEGEKKMLPAPSSPRAVARRRPSRIAPCLCLAALAVAGAARGDNGDIAGVSSVLSGKTLADITFDSRNPVGGSFWVAGEITGKLHQLSLDLTTVLQEVTNPHGTGSFPNFILTHGIAFRATTNSLFILAEVQGAWRVREVRPDGTEITAGAFTITPPDPATAALRGLAFDTLERKLWCLDAANDILILTDLSGAAVRVLNLPGDQPPETIIRGEGLSFELEEVTPGVFEPRLYVACGDIFRKNPSRILQLTPDTGSVTGIEVPLGKINSPDLRGFQTFRAGPQRRVAVVTGNGQVVQVEQVIPQPVPPSLLECRLSRSNKVELQWQNNGTSVSRVYLGEIIILRNGVPFTTVPGSTTSFTDLTPLEGTSTYSLKASDAPGGPFSPAGSECQVTVGTSGIVRWIPFPGETPFDVAQNPETREIFVTDDAGLDGQGKIYRFDESLILLGQVPSPWEHPGPIAFIPSIQIQQVTLQNVLAVGRTDGVLVRIMDLNGAEKTTFSLETTGPVGALAYIPSSQEFAFTEPAQARLVVADKSGRRVRECVPNPILNLPPYSTGVTYDPLQNTFLTLFQRDEFLEDRFVREHFTGGQCVTTNFQISMKSLGERYLDPSFFGGIQIAGNTLLVCGRESRALFQVLIFPFSPPFRRGDFDRNGSVNIADAVATAAYLFRAGPPPTCADSADSNDDGVLDVGDPVYLLFHLFLQGPPPDPPYDTAGSDPTFRDNLGCEED